MSGLDPRTDSMLRRMPRLYGNLICEGSVKRGERVGRKEKSAYLSYFATANEGGYFIFLPSFDGRAIPHKTIKVV